MIDYGRLERAVEARSEEFRKAWPFPHLVLDSFLVPGACETLREGFPQALQGKDPSAPKKHLHVKAKIGTINLKVMTPEQKAFFEEVNAPAFLRRLEALTGIRPLYPDPALAGGGLHEIHPGGFLNVHTDFNYHPSTGRLRALNLILYLNPDWMPEHEGRLELWPADMDRAPVEVEPRMNRAVVFQTSEISFHGHPKPYRAPAGFPRRSMAVYYYADWPASGLERREKTNYRYTPDQQRAIDAELERAAQTAGWREGALLQALPMHPPEEVRRSVERVRSRGRA